VIGVDGERDGNVEMRKGKLSWDNLGLVDAYIYGHETLSRGGQWWM
jgi:hypothetical protein